jgi:protein SCO1/2
MWTAGALVAGLIVIAAIMLLLRKPSLHGAVISPPLAAAEIHLVDASGRRFRLSGLHGEPSLIYFGYTNCPDECPLTMAHMKLAVDMLGKDAAKVRVIMISTDAVRDTPEALREFLAKFDSAFIGLTGTAAELGKVWKDYGVTVENGGETHSNFVSVIDADAYFTETFLPDSPPADVAADLFFLLRR